MKTIYTDKLGLYPWVMLILSAISFWNAFDPLSDDGPFGVGNRIGSAFWAVCGCWWLFLALKRLRQVRLAKRQGSDHTVIDVGD